MNVLVIDGQGGGIGRALVEKLKSAVPSARVTAVGANATATAAMLRAGADAGATGENAVKVACRQADVIVGALGIVLADAMLGEITPEMARAVSASAAQRVLIPVQRCGTQIAGVQDAPMSQRIDEAVRAVAALNA